MSVTPFLWVALDGLARDTVRTLGIAKELNAVPGNFGFKVNLDYFLRYGVRALREHPLHTRPIFADLKMWNGARTMAQAFCDMHQAGVTAVNAHALAGGFAGSGDELKRAIDSFKNAFPDSQTRIYGVTILSHYDDGFTQRQFGKDFFEEVRRLAIESGAAGVDGVIAPGTCLHVIGNLPRLKVLTGIRPSGYQDGRHKQEITPEEVAGLPGIEVVCGSPITKADDPVNALKNMLVALQG